MEDYWNYHDKRMKELREVYDKTSKSTQNRLQALLDTFKFTSDNLYNIADTQTKNRINTYIEDWEKQGLLTGYFKVLCENVYNKISVKNSEILEILIYSVYIEEQSNLNNYEQDILYRDVNHYYQRGIKEASKKKIEERYMPTIEWAIFLAMLNQAQYNGYTFQQNIDIMVQYNAQQMYKQAVLDIMQDNGIDIFGNDFQRIINQQNNQKLCINGDKISGMMDLETIGLNNQAKVNGIKDTAGDNVKVRFIAVRDERTTKMCESLDGQEFYVDKENVFKRYYGNTQKDLELKEFKVQGLVLGINLPPISGHFHYCRSTITYQI